MSKTIISVLIIAAVVIGGYLVIKNNKQESAVVNTNTENTVEEERPVEGKKMAFSEFIKQGGSYKCEVNYDYNDVNSKGTMYISGTDMRGNYTTVASGTTIESNFLMHDGYAYNWSSSLPNTGFKIKIDTNAGSTTGGTTASISGTYGFDSTQVGDYNCEPWTRSEATFALPAGITFKDLASFKTN